MASIFTNNSYEMSGAFSANSLILSFSEKLAPQIVQSINVGMTQNVTRLYEVGGVNANGKMRSYYIAGRTQGQAGLQEVIGPRSDDLQFRQKFSDVCNAAKNNMLMSFTSGCTYTNVTGQAIKAQTRVMGMYACVITQYSIAVQSGDNVINASTAMQFMDLDESVAA